MGKNVIRTIRFGIRIKFTIVLIAAIGFCAGLLVFAVFNQNERKITDSIRKISGTILNSAAPDAELYLKSLHQIADAYAEPGHLNKMKINVLNGIKKSSYYSLKKSVSAAVKSEKMIDIMYCINIKWRDTDFKINRYNQAQFLYFDQRSGNLFAIDNTRRSGRNYFYTARNGRYDELLTPTVFSHFMQYIDTGNYLKTVKSKKKGEQNFVIVGIPLFEDSNARSIYTIYNDFTKKRLKSKKDIIWQHALRKQYRTILMNRILNGGIAISYTFDVTSKQHINILGDFVRQYFDIESLDDLQQMELMEYFEKQFNVAEGSDSISITRFKSIIWKIQGKYNLEKRAIPGYKDSWFYFFNHLLKNSIPVEVPPLHELAQISFRMDLSGILGLYVNKDVYSSEMTAGANEIINLAVSILIRAIFIALFFPAFIIRSISVLEKGAYEIGTGNFNTTISLKGNDELGRLADILNVMTKNLSNAQHEKIEKLRMEKELKTAEQIQAALLPKYSPKIPGLTFGAYYSAQTESGGDYYDFISLGPASVGVVIADVSGHGVGSGLVMAMTRTLLHTYCAQEKPIKPMLESINAYLYKNTAHNYFVSLFYGIIDISTMRLSYCSAGHNQGLVTRNSEIIKLESGGIALGAVPNTTFSGALEIKEFPLKNGDCFVHYTDGVVETMNPANQEYGEERFHAILKRGASLPPMELIAGAVHDMRRYSGGVQQHDDVCMIAVSIG